MAVAHDANGTLHATNAITSVSDTSLTVGAVSNPAVVCTIAFSGTTTWPTGLTATWNGVSMTEITGTRGSDPTANVVQAIFGLTSAATGNHTLAISWTGSANCYSFASSYSGVGSFGNGANNAAVGSVATVTVTSATGNMVIGVHGQGASVWGAHSGTTLYQSVALARNSASNFDNGAASVALTENLASSINFISSGADIQAVGGGGGSTVHLLMMMGVG